MLRCFVGNLISILAALSGPISKAPGFAGGYLPAALISTSEGVGVVGTATPASAEISLGLDLAARFDVVSFLSVLFLRAAHGTGGRLLAPGDCLADAKVKQGSRRAMQIRQTP